MQRIAIIGAGAAGLCAARHLSCSKNYEPVVFETTNQVAGTWVYTDLIDRDQNGQKIHSSMYKNLRTNLPKEVMLFPDLPFDPDLPSFIEHTDVREYLNTYCDCFDLRRHIKFETCVEKVVRVSEENMENFPKWKVTSFDFRSKVHETQIYDGVFVCNGHYSDPYAPQIDNVENYKGNVIHSHQYREPATYKDHTVVLLGGGASGSDIAIDLSKFAKKVVISHCKAPLVSILPDNVTQSVGVKSFTENGVIFDDDSSLDCDDFIFCTGYYYSFPFFEKDEIVRMEDKRVTPLHKHLVHIDYNNLFFIGLCKTICPFPQFHCQVLYCLSILNRTLKLPSRSEMLAMEEQDLKDKLATGLKVRHAHVLESRQWAYNDYLADASSNSRIPDNVRLLYDLTHARRKANLATYKQGQISKNETSYFYI